MIKKILLIALMLNSFTSHNRMHVKVDTKSTLTIAHEENFFKYLNNTLNNFNNRLLDLEDTFDNYETVLKGNNKTSKANNARKVIFKDRFDTIQAKSKGCFLQAYQTMLDQAKRLDADYNSVEKKREIIDKLKQQTSVEAEKIFKNIAKEKQTILKHHAKEKALTT